MRATLILCLLFFAGCATKYIIPGNRFTSPETQGGIFRGQAEFQQSSASQLAVDVSNGSITDGVTYQDVTRSGFLLSNSLFDQFDIIWSHTGSANSMMGGKFQVLGGSRSSKSAGHKLSLGLLGGGNDHETDDHSVEFNLSGLEYLLVYGYRITENFLPYVGLSHAKYTFSGKINSSDPTLDGLRPEYVSVAQSLNGGIEFSLDALFAKVEMTYQQLKTDKTADRTRFMFGYSVGYQW
jgi:hypothetical protein